MVMPPPGTSSAPGVSPLVQDYRRYERTLRREILNPIMRDAEERIRLAGQHYGAIRIAINQIPPAPPITPLAQAAATAHAIRLRRYHTQRFTRVMSNAFGVNVGPLVPDVGVDAIMRQSIQTNVDLIKTIPTRFHAQLTSQLTNLAGTAAFDEQEMSRVLRQTYRLSDYNVRRISRDQTSKMIADFNRARQQQIGVREYIWRTVSDERVRDSHAANDGLVFSWSSPPPVTGHPGNDIQCFPGSVRIAPLGLKASVSYRYVGKLVEIVLRNGVNLTTTPNHPILTKSGWRSADTIKDGEELLVHPAAREFSLGTSYPDLNEVHPSAEDLHRFFGGLTDLSGARSRSVDLHSSPGFRDVDVDVVYPKRELRDSLETLFHQEVINVLLERAYVDFRYPLLSSLSVLFTRGTGLSSLSSSFIGGFSQFLSLLGTEFGHPNEVSFASAPWFKSQFTDTQGYGRSGNFEMFGHSQYRDSVGVHGSDSRVQGFPFLAPNDIRLVLDSEITKTALHDFIPDAEFLSDISTVETGVEQGRDLWQVLRSSFTPVRVSSVRVLSHDGPVYVQETESGLIIANGIVTHNCRCRADAVVPRAVIRPIDTRVAARQVARFAQPLTTLAARGATNLLADEGLAAVRDLRMRGSIELVDDMLLDSKVNIHLNNEIGRMATSVDRADFIAEVRRRTIPKVYERKGGIVTKTARTAARTSLNKSIREVMADVDNGLQLQSVREVASDVPVLGSRRLTQELSEQAVTDPRMRGSIELVDDMLLDSKVNIHLNNEIGRMATSVDRADFIAEVRARTIPKVYDRKGGITTKSARTAARTSLNKSIREVMADVDNGLLKAADVPAPAPTSVGELTEISARAAREADNATVAEQNLLEIQELVEANKVLAQESAERAAREAAEQVTDTPPLVIAESVDDVPVLGSPRITRELSEQAVTDPRMQGSIELVDDMLLDSKVNIHLNNEIGRMATSVDRADFIAEVRARTIPKVYDRKGGITTKSARTAARTSLNKSIREVMSDVDNGLMKAADVPAQAAREASERAAREAVERAVIAEPVDDVVAFIRSEGPEFKPIVDFIENTPVYNLDDVLGFASIIDEDLYQRIRQFAGRVHTAPDADFQDIRDAIDPFLRRKFFAKDASGSLYHHRELAKSVQRHDGVLEVLDDEAFQQVEGVILYRAVSSVDFVEDGLNGNWWGSGYAMGGGNYFAEAPALIYGRPQAGGWVMPYKLKKGSRVGTIEELDSFSLEDFKRSARTLHDFDDDFLEIVYSNPSELRDIKAILMKYDAITTGQIDAVGETVILNYKSLVTNDAFRPSNYMRARNVQLDEITDDIILEDLADPSMARILSRRGDGVKLLSDEEVLDRIDSIDAQDIVSFLRSEFASDESMIALLDQTSAFVGSTSNTQYVQLLNISSSVDIKRRIAEGLQTGRLAAEEVAEVAAREAAERAAREAAEQAAREAAESVDDVVTTARRQSEAIDDSYRSKEFRIADDGSLISNAEQVDYASYAKPNDYDNALSKLMVDEGGFTYNLEHHTIPEYASIFELPEGAVKYFLGGQSKGINRKLLNDIELDANEKQTLTELLGIAKPLDRDYVVYRGQHDIFDGDVMDLHAPLSTSISPHHARKGTFGGNENLYQITIPKGTRAIVTNDYELEILLMPGQRLVKYAEFENVEGVTNRLIMAHVEQSADIAESAAREAAEQAAREAAVREAREAVERSARESAKRGVIDRSVDDAVPVENQVSGFRKRIDEESVRQETQLEYSVLPDLNKEFPDVDFQRLIENTIDDTSVYMAINPETFAKILKSGKFKSAAESGKGTFAGSSNKKILERFDRIEKPVLGATDIRDVDSLPKYGFLADKDGMDFEKIVGFGYGDTYVRFKPNVRRRSSWTMGDSYAANLNDRIAPPSAITNPDASSSLYPLRRHWSGASREDSIEAASKWVETADYRDLSEVSRVPYLEAQIFGKLTPDDIAVIETSSIKVANKLRKDLDAAGLEDVQIVTAKFDSRLKNLITNPSEAALKPTDIDNLGDEFVSEFFSARTRHDKLTFLGSDFYDDAEVSRFIREYNKAEPNLSELISKLEVPFDFETKIFLKQVDETKDEALAVLRNALETGGVKGLLDVGGRYGMDQKAVDSLIRSAKFPAKQRIADTASASVKRKMERTYWHEVSLKEKGKLPKSEWENFVEANAGFTDDVLNKELLEDPYWIDGVVRKTVEVTEEAAEQAAREAAEQAAREAAERLEKYKIEAFAELDSADLHGTNLDSADLFAASLNDANLRGASLREADLASARLVSSDLREVDLRGATVSDADLRGADLRGADLRGADLRGADLRGADLTDVDLTDVNMYGANLEGAVGESAERVARELAEQEAREAAELAARLAAEREAREAAERALREDASGVRAARRRQSEAIDDSYRNREFSIADDGSLISNAEQVDYPDFYDYVESDGALNSLKYNEGFVDRHVNLPGYVDVESMPSEAQYYFGDGYESLVRKMRTNVELNANEQQMLTELLEIAKPLERDLVVYRGQFAITDSDVMDVLSPMSTSVSPHHARRSDFGGHDNLYQITIPKGTRVIITNEREAEILLMPGQRIVKYAEFNDVEGVTDRLILAHLEESAAAVAAREAAERAAREAAEQASREAAERAAREVAEQAAREAAEQAAREAREVVGETSDRVVDDLVPVENQVSGFRKRIDEESKRYPTPLDYSFLPKLEEQFPGVDFQRLLENTIDNTSVYMAIDPSMFAKVLKSGKFKNAAESGKGTFTGGSKKKIVARFEEVEKPVLGATDIKDVDSLPKYGFLADKDGMDFEKIVGFGYGETYVKFKPDVRRRATWVLGDSYDDNRTYIAPPSAITNPDASSSLYAMRQHLLGASSEETIEATSRWIQTADYRDLSKVTRAPYLEAQVFGKLTPNDIAVIETSSIKVANKLRKDLDAAGLEDVQIVTAKFDSRLRNLIKNPSEAALKPTDIDDLGDEFLSEFFSARIRHDKLTRLGPDFYDDAEVSRFIREYNEAEPIVSELISKLEVPFDFERKILLKQVDETKEEALAVLRNALETGGVKGLLDVGGRYGMDQKAVDSLIRSAKFSAKQRIADSASASVKRKMERTYWHEVSLKEKGKLPKSEWENFVEANAGFTDDVLNKELLEDPYWIDGVIRKSVGDAFSPLEQNAPSGLIHFGIPTEASRKVVTPDEVFDMLRL